MNPYGVPGGGAPNSGSDAYMFPGWGSVQSGYQGSSPYGPQGKPTWMGAASQLGSPFSKDPYWGNPVDNNSSAFQSLGTKPFDSAAWIGQRIAMPAAVFGAASAMFAGAGRNVGKGLAEGMFGSGLIARGVGGVMGTIGSFGLPFAIGTAAAHAVDSAIFQPYLRTRQQTEDVVRNFSGIAFGGTAGNPISGRGLSNYSASGIAQGVDRAGIRDMTFSSTQMHSIAGMGMRAGLFDDVSASGIQGRFKDIAAQVKLLVSISKDPNIQSAIEQLSQLRAGGASVSGGIHSTAARAFQQMGMQASMAGVSVQQLMAASASGQYMYQANGMTPYLGQMAAGNAYAGFSAAFRTGSLSPEVLARMGGLQGATNSALGGQVAAAHTPYNMLSLYNQNFGGTGPNGSMTNVAQGFGALASRNPLQAAGGLLLYGPAMMSQQSREIGGRAADDQASVLLRSHGVRPAGAGGLFTPEQKAMAFQSMGMSDDQIRAYASQRATDTDPATVKARLEGIDAQGREQLMQTITQNGMYDGTVGRAITSVRHGLHSAQTSIANNLAYPVANAAARASDWFADTYQDAMYGSTTAGKSNDFSGGKRLHSNRGGAGGDLSDALNREAGRPGALGDQARKILAGQADSKSVAQFSRDAGLDNVNQAMENGPDLYSDFAKDINDSKITYADGKATTKNEMPFSLPYSVDMDGSLRIAGQARDMIMEADKNGLSLGTDMDSMLKNGKYSDLSKQLSKYTPAQRAAAVKYDAAYASRYGYNDRSKKLDGQRVNFDFNSPVSDIAKMISTTRATDEAHQRTLDSAKGDTDWSTMTSSMKKFDDSVDKFANAVASMPGAKVAEGAGKKSVGWGEAWDQMWGKTKVSTPGG